MIIILAALARLKSNTLDLALPEVRRTERLPIARRRITQRDRDRMVELYEDGMDSREVAAELGVVKSTVLRTLRARGVEVRPWGVSIKGFKQTSTTSTFLGATVGCRCQRARSYLQPQPHHL